MAACPEGETCTLTHLPANGASVVLQAATGDIAIFEDGDPPAPVEGARLTPTGTFDFDLPETVAPVVAVGDTEVTTSIESFAPEKLLPLASVFEDIDGGTCGTRTIDVPTASDYAMQAKLAFLSDMGDDLGVAELRGSERQGTVTNTVEWIYASDAMQVAWTSEDGACVFAAPDDDGITTDDRPATLALDVDLVAGWNMVLRTSTLPQDAAAAQVFAWTVIDEVPETVRWHADAVRLDPASTMARRLGLHRGTFEGLLTGAGTRPQVEDGQRPRRSSFRTFLEQRP